MGDENKDMTLSDDMQPAQTVDDIAKAKNKRRESADAKLRDKVRNFEKNKKEVERLQAEMAKAESAIKAAREKNRNHAMIQLGTTVVAMFGCSDKDKECVTKKDYKNLTNSIITDIKKLQGEDTDGIRYDFDYYSLVYALGFAEDEKQCEKPEDYKTLNEKIYAKVKELMQKNADERRAENENAD